MNDDLKDGQFSPNTTEVELREVRDSDPLLNGRALSTVPTERLHDSETDTDSEATVPSKLDLFKSWVRREPLLLLTLAGVGLGCMFGAILRSTGGVSGESLELLALPGELFLRGLKLLVLPLLVGSLLSGVLSLGRSAASENASTSSSGQIYGVARHTLQLYFGSTVLAAAIGILVVSVAQPGVGVSLEHSSCTPPTHSFPPPSLPPPPAPTQKNSHSMFQAFQGLLRQMVPSNIVQAAAESNILGVICFTLALGVALASGTEAQVAATQGAVDIFNGAIERMMQTALWATPFGILSLLAAQIAGTCHPVELLVSLSRFIAAYLCALIIHAGLAMPAVVIACTRCRLSRIFEVVSAAAPALAAAFATDSSLAALPVTLQCVTRPPLRVPSDIASFMLPLGATVNMNGTALYEALAVLFLAQVHGADLGLGEMVIVVFSASLAAVGAAAIPSAGLVTMIMVLEVVGMEEYAPDIALFLACDWILDRCRTVVNVLGDVYVTFIVNEFIKSGTMPLSSKMLLSTLTCESMDFIIAFVKSSAVSKERTLRLR
ncbi:hypothetical protein CYMTET_18176 [Cymbomonas tetramitiformis]|uniref:Amino acid transporter n=1 Tax=Cymbomonas tetramitiformis TaxID=36881 RepID=A0AAE0G8L3_9CHLO|nr:hypothetical protein CYMTET_18176 [Cymbomonas tetramitiformis]